MSFCAQFSLSVPLVLAPMAGGPGTPALAAAVSRAGGLGSLPAAYLEPTAISAAVAEYRARTDRPFAINLFAPEPEFSVPDRNAWLAAVEATREFRAELNLPEPSFPPAAPIDFTAQVEAALRARPAVLSFVFGPLPESAVRAARGAGIYLLGTATTAAEARALEESGAHAVVAQGFEAGGHRGIFSREAPEPGVSTLALTAELRRAVRLPVIAAGGIMSGAAAAAALRAGASAVQVGTAFLLCPEAGTAAPYRAALAERTRSTALTRAFSGRLARGLENKFLVTMRGRPHLAFPAQNAFTRDLRTASLRAGSAEALSLWAGTGAAAIRADLAAAELVARFATELREAGAVWP